LAKVTAPRIALWDTYGGSMPSGWVRWLMEQYRFDAEIIYAKDIDAGDLKKKYDVIIFVTRVLYQQRHKPVPITIRMLLLCATSADQKKKKFQLRIS
jgi:hypothetical protein